MRCPSIKDAMRMLEVKRRLALEAYKYDTIYKRFLFDIGPIVKYASQRFGGLQRIDESIPTDESKLRSIIETVPGLLTCINAEFRARKVYKNEILALEGPGGSGKSAIAWWLAKMTGGVMLTPDMDVVRAIYDLLREGRWVPILVLDDIASVVSKYWFMDRVERRKWTAFFRAFEYIRDIAGVVLLTARSFQGIAKKLRELSTLVGTMKRLVVADEYIIDIIEWRKAGTQRYTRPEFIDVVWPGVRIPDEEFEAQLRRRREIAMKLLEASLAEDEHREDSEVLLDEVQDVQEDDLVDDQEDNG